MKKTRKPKDGNGAAGVPPSALAPIGAVPVEVFAEKAYLHYAMYVISDRALPHIGDGLKPVQRRILYAMRELGLENGAKHKKSARTIGDVIGKYHPHGDTSCYEAMVLMAQPFSYRYPLIDGQGNFGALDDPKSFAAMRYTEARLSPFAECLLQEIDQGGVDWQPNFDGTLIEPRVLPAVIPHILLNGTMGIAVGMATDIPPHHVGEVIDALKWLLEHPDCTVSDLMAHIQGPDFPTAAEVITPRATLRQIYETGNGVVRQRAVYHVEAGNVVITALPYQVSPSRILEDLARLMEAKKIPWIVDLRDESDQHHPLRVVLILRHGQIDIDQLMRHLFAVTDLERGIRVNLNMIGLDGKPQVKDLKTILAEFLVFRRTALRRRFQHRLDQIRDRREVLAGLLLVFLQLDRVIAIIRDADDPKAELIAAFALTERQAQAILEIRLRQLAKLARMAIEKEDLQLAQEEKTLEKRLHSEKTFISWWLSELDGWKARYDSPRRSPLVLREEAAVWEAETASSTDPVTVVLSQMGWIRQAKGHVSGVGEWSYKTGDGYQSHLWTHQHEKIMVWDKMGRFYTLPVAVLPSARGHGEPVTTWLSPPSGVTMQGMVAAQGNYVVWTNDGYGFQVSADDCVGKSKNGKQIVRLKSNAHTLQGVLAVGHAAHVWIQTRQGLLIFPVSELPQLPKGTGLRMVRLAEDDQIVHVGLVGSPNQLRPVGKKIPAQWDTVFLSAAQGTRGGRVRPWPRGSHIQDIIVQASDPQSST